MALSSIAENSQTWPLWWRVWLLGNICVFILMGNWFTACISPLLGELAGYFRTDINGATHLITYVLLSIGMANVVAVPIAQYVGKRNTVLVSLSLFLACSVWCSFETRYKAFEAARILGGLGAGVVEALGPLIVAECFPERQLATAMVGYVLCLGAGSSLGPFVAGVLDHAGYNWHWNFKIISIILGVNLLSCIIMLPETVDQDLSEEADSRHASDVAPDKDTAVDVEQIDNIPNSNRSLKQVWARRSFAISPGVKPERNFFLLLIQPWSTLASPAVLFTSIVFGLMIADTVIISVVLPSTLAPPPFLWTPLKIGLINLSTITGYIIGIPIGGILADFLSRRSARINGEHVRESRLPAILPGAIIGPIGIIIVGLCLHEGKIWAGLAVGWGMLSVALTASANPMLTYCVDNYPWRAADIGVVVNTLKNLIAFGVGYGVTPWLMAVGPLKQFATMAGILWFFLLFFIPIFMFGPKLRHWSLRYIM